MTTVVKKHMISLKTCSISERSRVVVRVGSFARGSLGKHGLQIKICPEVVVGRVIRIPLPPQALGMRTRFYSSAGA